MDEEMEKIREAARQRRFGGFVQSLLKIDTEKMKLNGAEQPEPTKDIRKDLAKEAHEASRREAEEAAKNRKQSLIQNPAIPAPPKEMGEDSELATFIRNNFSSVEVGIKQLYDKIYRTMKAEHNDKFSLNIDDYRSFEFVRDKNNNTVPVSVSILDKKHNTIERLLYVDEKMNIHGDRKSFSDKVSSLLTELGVSDKEKPDITEYEHRTWDISYQDCPEAEKLEKINKNYFEMKHSGYYSDAQLNVLYKAMYVGYDVNCFANPLYNVDNLMVLINLYERKQTPEHENLLRDINKFCSNNFKYPFSTTEFGTIINAAYHNNLNKLMSNPNINAEFKLFYLFDQAFDDKEPQKYNIGNTVFVIKSDMEAEKGKVKTITNSVYVEVPDGMGKVNERLIYSTSTNGQIKGDLNMFFKMYNEKHSIKDASALLNVYMDEVRTAVKDDTNFNNEVKLKLNNGDKLVIRGIKYDPNGVYVVNSDILKTGCEVILEKKNSDPVRVYTDNPNIQISTLINLNNLIKQAGGLENRSRVTKGEETIEDAVLRPVEKIENGPEDVFKQYEKLAKQDGRATLELSNGKSILFTARKFKENDIEKQEVAIFGLNEAGKREAEFKNIFKGPNGIERTGSVDAAIEYYKKTEYGKNIDEVINVSSKIESKPMDRSENTNKDIDAILDDIYNDKDI